MIPPELLATAASSGKVWRIVENQEQAATRNITRSAEAQSRLEELLDSSKPAYLPGSEQLHWLLKTPFRYPPLRHGSRFGSATEPGILYGSCERDTAMIESAVYLWLFRAGPEELGPLQQIRDARTALRFPVCHPLGCDLTRTEVATYQQRISCPRSYEFSQSLGSALRAAGAGMIWFRSARAVSGTNCAVLDPCAVAGADSPEQEHWQIQLDAHSCWWGRPGHTAFEVSLQAVTDATGVIPHPAL